MTLTQIIEDKITELHENGYGATLYINAIDCDGDCIKIRVSNHCSNDRNNNERCLSFISKSNMRQSGQWENVTEWVIDSDLQTKDYLSIDEILSDYCLVSFEFIGNTYYTI